MLTVIAVCRGDAQPLFADESKTHRLAFALISEAIMRSCRVQLRVGKSTHNSTYYIRHALDLLKAEQDKTGAAVALLDPAVPSIDVNKSSASTGRLLLNRNITNCTATSVVQCLILLNCCIVVLLGAAMLSAEVEGQKGGGVRQRLRRKRWLLLQIRYKCMYVS